MSSEVETSLIKHSGRTVSVPSHYLGTRRSSSLPHLLVLLFGVVNLANARETPSSTASPSPTTSPSLTLSPSPTSIISPSATTSPKPAPSPSATAGAARSVRISFLPPPLEGTISLGIYDEWGQLVRVLHQEAELDEFTVGEDALVTKWDGRNDDGEDLASGKYHGHGYLVGHLKEDELGKALAAAPDFNTAGTVQIKLMPNPLANDERPIVVLAVGFDDENSFLRTADGLPLFTISKEPKLIRAAITKNGEKSVDVWQDDSAVVEQFRVSNVDKMMAFDCGDFELR
jgi:hypothetical protein